MERRFIDWNQPFLPAAVELLADRYRNRSAVDLSGVFLVFPGARAGRRFLDLMLRAAQRRELALDPPRCVTTGLLAELLIEPARPLADPVACEMAWIGALREANPEVVAAIAAKPGADSLRAWSGLARMLAALHRELASEGLDFPAALERGRPSMPGESEEARWRALSELQRGYLVELDAAGLDDPARALGPASTQRHVGQERDIVLMSVVELSQAHRTLLREQGDRVLALVHAPPDLGDRFDALGCLRVDAWNDLTIDLNEEQIVVADRPTAQADAVVRCLQALPDSTTRTDVAVGVADPELSPHLIQALSRAGLSVHEAAGRPLERSDPYALLRGVSELLRENRYENLAALVRHPRVWSWLRANEDGLAGDDPVTRLDRAYREHLPHALDDLPAASLTGSLGPVLAGVRRLLGTLDAGPRPLRQWAEPILDLLAGLYDDPGLDPTRPRARLILEALEVVASVCDRLMSLSPALSPAVDSHEAVDLVLRQARTSSVPLLPADDSIELLGWLELRLDDAPALVVAGMNEGRVPESLVGDPLLPNALRVRLGLVDNRGRAARDAYALSALAASRSWLRLVAGRRSARLDPLRPSRLLLACRREQLPARVLRFTAEPEGPVAERAQPPAEAAGSLHRYFREPPRPESTMPLDGLRVTAFGDYLRCPYRFYLKHVLGLRATDDRALELDGAGFGALAHDILMRFGRSAERHSEDAREIRDRLFAELEQRGHQRFGPRPRAALWIQMEQLRARLERFARWQAARTREGWRIEAVELALDEKRCRLVVDDRPVTLRGRIDRVERHQETGRVAILDFKTSDRAISPEAVHRDGSGAWIDLQLPLYAHGLRQMRPFPLPEAPLELAYLSLPRDLEGLAYEVAPWSPGELAASLQVAEDVVRHVRGGVFWPPTSPPPPFSGDYAGICLDEQLTAPPTQSETTP